MKLRYNNRVFLQQYDVAFLLDMPSEVPSQVYDEIFLKDAFYDKCSIDGYGFIYSFIKRESVEWLMSQDYILDYDDYRGYSPQDLERMISQTNQEFDELSKEFSKKDKRCRDLHFNEMNLENAKIGHRIKSLVALYKYRNLEIEFAFPDQIPKRAVSKKSPSLLSRLLRNRAQ